MFHKHSSINSSTPHFDNGIGSDRISARRYFFRSIPALGWIISVGCHLILACMFLLFSYSDSNGLIDQKAIPKSTLEPVIENLQIEPARTNIDPLPAIYPDPLPVQISPLPSQAEPPIDALSIVRPPDGSQADNTINTLPATSGTGSIYQSRFCGASGNGTRICYVVDCSGSMVMAFEYVRLELHRAIARLTPVQYFQIIFFAGSQPQLLSSGSLLRATTENKATARQFIDQIQLTRVRTTEQACQAVIQAMETAFTARDEVNQPIDLIYFLTDGDYDHQQLDQAIKRLQNQHPHRVAIHVIACGNQENQNYLRRLALINNGQYTYLSDEELSRMASYKP